MILFRTSPFSSQIKLLFKNQNSLYKHFPPSSSLIIRTLNSSLQEPTKKPLSLMFEEAVGLTEKTGGNEGQSQDEKNERTRKVRELERDVREFKENPKPQVEKEAREGVERGKPKEVNCLAGLFGGEKMAKSRRKSGEVTVLKDLSVFVKVFVRYLYSKGYFDKANFLVDNKLDFGYFDNSYGRDFIKSAAYKFGKDNEEIAKLLSGNHLKKVAVFGCPSLDKNNVFPAKRLRKIFTIQEDTVCSQCILKDSCRFANKGVSGIAMESLLLVDVMKVIILYALEQEHPKLAVPEEVRDSANKLLEEVVKLSQTT
ncbi:Detected protein of unknown function [Hibiscus syriacus]|uniref:Uncharacterized protein n=1 Tax=Hibiscus syriacus TaxID=106335 RepID=A0A6A3CH56_HIBSY|nr:uncharacterized protein LOC120200572 [Hibiscus syriacus]KAE8726792.1 Detected protein of unknown function [Hibiscus syriacus]